MNLRQFYNKKVRIVDMEGKSYEGKINDYTFPKDNPDTLMESIIIDDPKLGYPVEFYADEIQSIEIIK